MEIRTVANCFADLVSKIEPFFNDKLVSKCLSIGYCPEKACCGLRPPKRDVLGTYKMMTEGGKTIRGDSN